jgi:hypothetical protein
MMPSAAIVRTACWGLEDLGSLLSSLWQNYESARAVTWCAAPDKWCCPRSSRGRVNRQIGEPAVIRHSRKRKRRFLSSPLPAACAESGSG